MYDSVPLITVGSTASIIVGIPKRSIITQEHTKVSNIVTKHSRGCRTFNDTLRNICRHVTIKSRVISVFGCIIDMIALRDAGTGQVVCPLGH